jgi:hypothetical protein
MATRENVFIMYLLGKKRRTLVKREIETPGSSVFRCHGGAAVQAATNVR